MLPLQVRRLRHAELPPGWPVGRGQDGLLLQGDTQRDSRRRVVRDIGNIPQAVEQQ